MKEENRKKLIKRYLNNEASLEEIKVFFEELKDESFVKLLQDFEGQASQKIIRKTSWRKSLRWAAAASVLVGLTVGIYQWQLANSKVGFDSHKTALENYLPAKNKAIMTIDGQEVASLTDSTEFNDKLIYFGKEKDIQYVSVATQVANTFRMALPDGSIVYLNAASKIRFPKEFAEDVRRVELSGEAYFEVKSDSKYPFVVATHTLVEGEERSMDVQVTGTRFLVSNYSDQYSAHTVLIEGKVAVNKANILPGYMYELKKGRETISQPISLNRYIDWVDGVFEFDGETISSILYKVEKWYGVKFVGKKVFNDKNFGGVISRDVPLKDILTLLEENADLHFQESANNQITIL